MTYPIHPPPPTEDYADADLSAADWERADETEPEYWPAEMLEESEEGDER